MANLARRILHRTAAPDAPDGAERADWPVLPGGVDQWLGLQQFGYQGLDYEILPSTAGTLTQTQPGNRVEEPGADYAGYSGLYRGNAVVYSCVKSRLLVFTEARFQFRQRRSGRPGDYFGTPALAPLETPWPGATTGDLLARMLLDVDLTGNAYVARRGQYLRPMRPDWVTIVLGVQGPIPRQVSELDYDVLGYAYHPGGINSGEDPVILLPENVAHFAPEPDPYARFRGMSWLTPVVREVMADGAATEHKLTFFENAAPQPLDAAVLTPQGWSTMGAMTVDDQVIGSDGRAHDVIGVYPQGRQNVYRVTFSDGGSTECTADHLWTVQSVYDRKFGRTRTLSLSDIIGEGVAYPSGPLRWSVPNVEPVEYDVDPSATPMDPYLLGLMLGDGSFRTNAKGSCTPSLATHVDDADELEQTLPALLPPGLVIKRRDRGNGSELRFSRVPTGRTGQGRANGLATIIRDLELLDVIGRRKFIPQPYLRATVADRIALLQGLIDSDGGIDRRQGNLVRYATTSEVLAAQIVDLVGSLGGVGTISRTRSRTTITVTIKRLPGWIVPCRLSRKVAAYRPNARSVRARYIARVDYVGRKPCQCIRVDTPDSLYVTDDYLLTHNTPNLVILGRNLKPEQARQIQDAIWERHGGVRNAYDNLVLGGVDDVKVVGATMEQISFKATQGHGETRVAAAAGVPPIIVGLSEGLESATYSNYAQAVRRFADATMRPLWRNAAGSLSRVVDVPGGSELWYDDRDVPFLKEDVTAFSAVQSQQAGTMRTLIDGGFEADAVVDAVTSGDFARLKGKHTGLTPVQLQKPGAGDPPVAQQGDAADGADAADAAPAANGDGNAGRGAHLLEQFIRAGR